MSVGGTIAAGSFLEANLTALGRANAAAAAAIRASLTRADVEFIPTEEGSLSAELCGGAGAQALASRRRPLAEAKAFVQAVDISQAGVYVVAGVGLGYHVAALLDRLNKQGMVVVFEPDAGLLRAVLERVDCSAWVGAPNLRLLVDAEDRGAMFGAMNRAEGLVGLGVRLVEHPVSRARLGERTARLYRNFMDVIDSVKMAVMTTMVQSRITIRNLTQNLDRYAGSAGVADLAGVCRGRAGLVVSAGPSLARNIDVLARGGAELRDRLVIVAAQTVLKPLLARGVRPHFVTALDWSDVGTRFYEGLGASDVEGITLVAEPKVNPAILEVWPGVLRCVGDRLCDRLLGKELAEEKGSLPSGATVAHLAYYLARYLGCDPVALVGQDLGFTDGQYYASGAAIHDVWAGELNEFNTLEMLEWQRIVRQGDHLRRATDTLGRPIYTDEQMLTYLTQFERDFKEDAAKGLTTIDATEGGVSKQHTRVQTLREFVEAHWERGSGRIDMPRVSRAAPARERIASRVREVRKQVERVGVLSREAAVHLAEMREHQADRRRVDRLIGRIEPLTKEVVSLDPGYLLVHTLGQTVAFARMRADRGIAVERAEGGLSALERQGRQVERDLENVRALAETAGKLGELLEQAVGALDGQPKVTRDNTEPTIERGARMVHERVRVPAIIPVDPSLEHLTRPIAGQSSVLAATIANLRRCEGVGEIVLVGDDVAAIRAMAERAGVNSGVEYVAAEPGEILRRRTHVMRARAWAADCWRGGIYNASCYDEVYLPRSMVRAMDALGCSAALAVGADWCLVDPVLCGAIIDRYAEKPEEHRFVFTQAAPGLAPCLVARELAEHFARAPEHGPCSAPIGGVLGYVPQAPMNDIIAGAGCVPVPRWARDAGVRLIADSAAVFGAIDGSGPGERALDAVSIDVKRQTVERGPGHLWLEIAPTEPRRMFDSGDAVLDEGLARRVLAEFAVMNVDGRLTLAIGGSSAAAHAMVPVLIAEARRVGIRHVHVRTGLRCDSAGAYVSGSDVVSVDLLADTAETYEAITGRNDFDRVRHGFEQMLEARGHNDRHPVYLPRLTRCDAVYADVEPFFARWIERAGWCVIDPAPSRLNDERIGPLMLPGSAGEREARTRLSILADGSVCAGPEWSPGATPVANVRKESLAECWCRAMTARGLA